jgi:hypothetical protein
MPHENENHRNISHHGLKEASGFAQRVDSSAGTEQPPGLLSMTPLNADPWGRGFKQPVKITPPSTPPRGDPAATTVRHDPSPHPRTADAIKKMQNTYGGVPYERR